MASDVTIYQKPTCSTCRSAMELLKSRGVDYDAIDYYIDPIPGPRLKELIQMMGISPIQLFRTKEEKYNELGIANGKFSEEELINILADNPELVQRPIVVRGMKAVLARPPEKVLELF